MDKSGSKRPRGGKVDTDDRIMETAGRAAAWTRDNQRVATILLVAVLAAGAIGVVYLNYRSDLRERAAVRLDEIRLASRTMPPAELRSQLGTYIEQYGSADQASEARLLLAEMELNRDSAAAAIRLVEPVVDLDGGPIGYNAGWILAVAREQQGDLARAAGLYEQLARSARHDYQRRRARAARARLHTYAGEYAAAEAIYAELAADDATGEDAEFYGVKLGEVRARAQADLPPPSVPEASVLPQADGAGTTFDDTARAAGAVEVEEADSPAGEPPSPETADPGE